MTKLFKAVCLFALVFSLGASGQEESEARLSEFLSANGLPADTIEQVLTQEFSDPHHLKGARVLSPYQVLRSSGVELSTIQHQYSRVARAGTAVGISVLLAAAGVACLFVPVPGARVAAVVLIKNGVAVAATATALAAGAAYTAGTVSEVRSLGQIRELIQLSLNEVFDKTPVGYEIGKIIKVNLSRKGGIEKFHTDKGFDFYAKAVKIKGPDFPTAYETIFLSYNAIGRFKHLSRWATASYYKKKVISLIDFLLYPLDAYLRLAVLERKRSLTPMEKVEFGTILSRQIGFADNFSKSGWKIPDRERYSEMAGKLIDLQSDRYSDRERDREATDILCELLMLRKTI
ncbi:hypothetical protein K2X33_04550 [bacterium]|nr:hypothetical protein [bacterium]